MEVRSHVSRAPTGDPRASRSLKMERAELVDDIFNNVAADPEERSAWRVKLSHGSRKLMEGLHKELSGLVEESEELKNYLNEVKVEGDSQSGNFLMRKMAAYVNWLRIHEQEGVEIEDPEDPFAKIHSLGKDAEIKEIFSQLDEQRRSIAETRRKQTPNYYYMVYPETYSFN